MSNHLQNNPPDWNGHLKRCIDCGEVKALDDFPPAKRRLDGRGSYCRACYGVRSKASYRKRQAEQGQEVREARITPPGQKWCNDCKKFKPLDDFCKNKRTKTGRASYCKDCHNARTRESIERLHGNPREYRLRKRYGVGLADVEAMLVAQGGNCAICGKAGPEHVDHDHETGKVRGLLCFNCNQALGNARDDIAVLRSMVEYLHGSRGVRHYAPFETYKTIQFDIEWVPAFLHARRS